MGHIKVPHFQSFDILRCTMLYHDVWFMGRPKESEGYSKPTVLGEWKWKGDHVCARLWDISILSGHLKFESPLINVWLLPRRSSWRREGTNCFGTLRCSMIHGSHAFTFPSKFYLWKKNSIPNFRMGCFRRILVVGNELQSPGSKQLLSRIEYIYILYSISLSYINYSFHTDHWYEWYETWHLEVHSLLRLSLPAHSGSEDLASGHLSHPRWA